VIDKLIIILTKAMSLTLAYFAPIEGLLCAVIVLFAIDWLTGVYKSYHKKIKFTSYRLRKSIHKLTSYIIAIVAAHILNATILSGMFHLPQIVAAYIGITELTSIYENLAVITGKKLMRDIVLKIKESINKKIQI
jgi:phage-related holin